MQLESYFEKYRTNIIGWDQTFETPFGLKRILYTDWTASGRMYGPIEDKIRNEILPFVGNTHTETSITGTLMTKAYHKAKEIIKTHVNANNNDVLIFTGSGMTGAINKMQRILGLRFPERLNTYSKEGKGDLWPHADAENLNKPVIFITHMEHHSNHTSWLETIADVEIIAADEEGLVNINHLEQLLVQYAHRKNKIVSVTSCSNVTGLLTPYHEIAKIGHAHGASVFVDFACSAPYIDINMHPNEEGAHLDAIFFSPHKFLGGPGTPGVLIFNSNLYKITVPDQPGGGTVTFTSPYHKHSYIKDIETREDGGTPPFLQGIKAAMCVKLKEEMGVQNMLKREEEILERIFNAFEQLPNLHILAGQHKHRMGVISFLIDNCHYNLVVKLLNDKFGIQTRGGCSCAGTYGHYLLQLDPTRSNYLQEKLAIMEDSTARPGWARLSIHPTMSNAEIDYIIEAVSQLCVMHTVWSQDYRYNKANNEYECTLETHDHLDETVEDWYLCG